MCKTVARVFAPALVALAFATSCTRISGNQDAGSETDESGSDEAGDAESSDDGMPLDTSTPPDLPVETCVSNTSNEELSLALGEECAVDSDKCMEGLKCSYFDGFSGEYAEPPVCVRVREPALEAGELCTPDGTGDPLDGLSACDRGLVCVGNICRPYCGIGGSCNDCGPMGEFCEEFPFQTGPRPAGICLNECSPVSDEPCPGNQFCTEIRIDEIPTHANYPWTFACFSPGGPVFPEGSSCSGSLKCETGLACIVKDAYGDGCEDGAFVRRCCSPYCEIGSSSCSGARTCIPVFPAGHPLDDVGVCAVRSNPLEE